MPVPGFYLPSRRALAVWANAGYVVSELQRKTRKRGSSYRRRFYKVWMGISKRYGTGITQWCVAASTRTRILEEVFGESLADGVHVHAHTRAHTEADWASDLPCVIVRKVTALQGDPLNVYSLAFKWGVQTKQSDRGSGLCIFPCLLISAWFRNRQLCGL